ncbi:hypothetical protein [Breoghania sp.]|uniref:hypothetical protein n=1 Tax=Breoghania sp. TaxID=2065378 RepID=UPI00261402EA|nr:hypothetical protein [Breoghania sp.]MDJ0930216.1 hypothetical protein [Breoghania sp.]
MAPPPPDLGAPPRALSAGSATANGVNGYEQNWQNPDSALWSVGGGTDDPALRDAVSRAVEANRINLYLQTRRHAAAAPGALLRGADAPAH